MIKPLSRFVFAAGLGVVMGCGGGDTAPAKATPDPDAAAKESMKKAMEGGGGPGMIEEMQKKGQTKPN